MKHAHAYPTTEGLYSLHQLHTCTCTRNKMNY